MRAGLLQQVGSPQELYANPNNLFVAGFIGSPAMNFLPGKLEENVLRTRLADMPLNDQLRQRLGDSGRDVIVGIRPENFEDASLVSPDNRPHGVTFNATIDVLEAMGSDAFVYFTLEGQQLASTAELEELARDSGQADTGASADQVVARLDAATRVHEGETAELWADTRAIHVFDPANGANLTLAQPATSKSAT